MAKTAQNGMIQERAQILVEAWLRGLNQGGHTVSHEDIAEQYRIALADVKAGRA